MDVWHRLTVEFEQAFIDLLTLMTSLHELRCYKRLTRSVMAILAKNHGRTLKKLVLAFDHYDPEETLPGLSEFVALRHLDLKRLHYPASDARVHSRTTIQSLQSLYIDAINRETYPVHWLNSSTFPELTHLRLQSDMIEQWTSITPFLTRHGQSLKIFGLCGTCTGFITTVFPHTPNLEVVEFAPTSHAPTNMTEELRGLPSSVTEIRIGRFGHQLGYYMVFLRQLLLLVEQLPAGHAIRALRVVQHDKHVDSTLYSWRKEVSNADKRRVKLWEDFTGAAVRLLELGVVVLDDEGVALTDVLTQEAVQEDDEGREAGAEVEQPGDMLGLITL